MSQAAPSTTSTPSFESLAEALDAAEQAGGTIDADLRASFTPSRAEGYEIQKLRYSKWEKEPFVWKIGGSNVASQAVFETTEAFAGPVRPEYCIETKDDEVSVEFPKSHSGLAEVEVAVKTKRDISADDVSKVTNEDFESIHLAIEFPGSRLGFKPDGKTFGWLVADNSTSGSFVMGKAIPVEAHDSGNFSGFSGHKFRCYADDELVAEADGNALVKDPLAIARELLGPITAQCGTLKAGSIISTGGITAGVPVGEAKEIRAEWSDVDILNVVRK